METTTLTPEQQFKDAFETLYRICEENNWGDPFSYARSREILTAITLEHRVAETYSGADAFDQDDKPVEYKSTINKNINGTYNGVSVKPTWEEQERYLIEEKLGKYHHHFYSRYEGGKIVEMWRLSSENVLSILLPKFKKDWERKVNGNHADPRLSGVINKREITQYGVRLDV